MFAKPRLRVESLERRDTPTVSLSNGVLTITGTNAADVVSVRLDANGTSSTSDDRVVVTEGTVTTAFPLNMLTPQGMKPFVKSLVFHGGDGNDSFTNFTGIGCTAYGDAGNDTLTGGTGADKLYGMADADELRGGDGNDTLHGGKGDDKLYGEGGADLLDESALLWFIDPNAPEPDPGAAGNVYETVEVQNGNDSLYGGDGQDTLRGGSGDDYLHGGIDGDRDTLEGGIGKDRFMAEYTVSTFGFLVNRDAPSDLSTAEGDSVVWLTIRG